MVFHVILVDNIVVVPLSVQELALVDNRKLARVDRQAMVLVDRRELVQFDNRKLVVVADIVALVYILADKTL